MGRAWVLEAKENQDTPAGKVMATVFLDAKGVMLDFFTQEKKNNWSVLIKLARPAENRHP